MVDYTSCYNDALIEAIIGIRSGRWSHCRPFEDPLFNKDPSLYDRKVKLRALLVDKLKAGRPLPRVSPWEERFFGKRTPLCRFDYHKYDAKTLYAILRLPEPVKEKPVEKPAAKSTARPLLRMVPEYRQAATG